MDFELTEDQRMIQESVRRFAAAEVAPGAKGRDHRAAIASELFDRLRELGLFELAAMGLSSAALALEELARQDASLAFHVALANFGGAAASSAVEVPGAERLGLRSAGAISGAVPSPAMWIAAGAVAVGIARAALEDALAYAQERKQFGKAIAEFQALQWMLADMATETDAARMLVHRAADLADRSAEGSAGAAEKARVYAAETAVRAAMKAIQIHGGIGFTRELAVERCCRDAKALEVWAGGSDRMRSAIAGSLLVG